MNVPRVVPRRKKRRSSLRMLLAVMMTTTMVATGGFGTFPANPLTQTFQQVISENVSADFLQPVNSYMDNIAAPTLQSQPHPASGSDADQPFDLVGLIVEAVSTQVGTLSTELPASPQATISTASIVEQTQTLSVTTTPVLTLTPALTFTTIPTFTFVPTASLAVPTLIPTRIVYPTLTRTPIPPDPDTATPAFTATATLTATATPTFTPTVTPAGFTLSSISLNTLTNGGAIFVFPSNTFTVNYSYTVWAQSNCAGCVIQLVSGMGASGGVGTTSCAYTGLPGVSPGTSGTSSLTLTAPATVGTYDIVVQLLAQTDCATAISNYSGASGIYQTIGQVVVHSAVNVVFDGGLHDGSLGGRSGADAVCVAAKPGSIGNPNVRALVAFSPSDTIAGMPLLSPPVPDNVPIVFQNGQLIGKDWADMLDGSINAALTLSGVPAGRWWSGAETDAGTVAGGTANCNGFTSNLSTNWGNAGNTALSGANWMNVTGNSQSCDQSFRLICLAHP